MHDVTRILSAIEQGDSQAAGRLLPLVYDELRKLAAVKLAQERPGHTLQATALVHEAYLRLVGSDSGQRWDNRSHFFAAAAFAVIAAVLDSLCLLLRRQTDRDDQPDRLVCPGTATAGVAG